MSLPLMNSTLEKSPSRPRTGARKTSKRGAFAKELKAQVGKPKQASSSQSRKVTSSNSLKKIKGEPNKSETPRDPKSEGTSTEDLLLAMTLGAGVSTESTAAQDQAGEMVEQELVQQAPGDKNLSAVPISDFKDNLSGAQWKQGEESQGLFSLEGQAIASAQPPESKFNSESLEKTKGPLMDNLQKLSLAQENQDKGMALSQLEAEGLQPLSPQEATSMHKSLKGLLKQVQSAAAPSEPLGADSRGEGPLAPMEARGDFLNQDFLGGKGEDSGEGDSSPKDLAKGMDELSLVTGSSGTKGLDKSFASTMRQVAEAGGEPSIDNMDSVIRQVRTMVKEGGGAMKIELTPEGMGHLKLNVSVENGQVQVEMLTDNLGSKKLLEEGLADIRSQLEGQKLMVDTLKVEMGREDNRDFTQHRNFAQEEENKNFAQQFMDQFSRQREERESSLLAGMGSYRPRSSNSDLRLSTQRSYFGKNKGQSLNVSA